MSQSINGLRIVTNPLLIETVLHSRSPGRAKRRMRRGFRQNYLTRPSQAVYRMDDTLIMHPAVWDQVRREIELRQ